MGVDYTGFVVLSFLGGLAPFSLSFHLSLISFVSLCFWPFLTLLHLFPDTPFYRHDHYCHHYHHCHHRRIVSQTHCSLNWLLYPIIICWSLSFICLIIPYHDYILSYLSSSPSHLNSWNSALDLWFASVQACNLLIHTQYTFTMSNTFLFQLSFLSLLSILWK